METSSNSPWFFGNL